MRTKYTPDRKGDIKVLAELVLFVFLPTIMLFSTGWANQGKVKLHFENEPVLLSFTPEVNFDNMLGENTDQILDDTVNFIASFEGFHPECYWDVSGYTQGYGHKCISDRISEASSRAILRKEVARLYNEVPPTFGSEQLEGVISFLYNHPVNQEKYIEMLWSDPERFLSDLEYKANNYTWINGQRYGGLRDRRLAEFNKIQS